MQDKEEIMRKTKFLKGSSVYVGEDFSKRVRDQRHELQKFMKMMRGRRPAARFSLRYDKLFVDRDVFMFNDLTGQVEQVHHPDRDYGPHVDSPADQVESIFVYYVRAVIGHTIHSLHSQEMSLL